MSGRGSRSDHSSVPVEKLIEQLRGVATQRLGDLTELDHVQAALAPLHLRHEALGSPQSVRELDLGDAGGLPRRGDEADQLLVPLREDR